MIHTLKPAVPHTRAVTSTISCQNTAGKNAGFKQNSYAVVFVVVYVIAVVIVVEVQGEILHCFIQVHDKFK